MRVSPQGLAFVAQREGCVLTAYRDTKHLAIGFGWNKPGLQEGDTITLDEAVAQFVEHSAVYDQDMARVFGAAPLSQQCYDALYSLAYNIGGTQLRKETDLISAVIAHALSPGDRVLRDKAAYHLTRARFNDESGPFNFSRRCREALVYIGGDYGDLTTLKMWPVGKSPRNVPPDAPETAPMPVFR
jgi:GH24 family phage-related lysozyme (muramidase)